MNKYSILSLASREGVPLNTLTDKLHTSRKAVILAVQELQHEGHHIYINDGIVRKFEDDSSDIWAFLACMGFGLAFIMALTTAWLSG